MKITVLAPFPVQYYAPIWRTLHELVGSSHEVDVLYATDLNTRASFDAGFGRVIVWDEPLLSGYSCKVLGKERHNVARKRGLSFFRFSGKGVLEELMVRPPDCVLLQSISYEFDLISYLSALLLRIPIGIRFDTTDSRFERGPIKEVLRTGFYKVVYATIEKVFYVGKSNYEHYRTHDVGEAKLIRSPHCVVNRYQGLNINDKEGIRSRMRAALGIGPDVRAILFCGKLQPIKNPELLLGALAEMDCRERERFHVLFIGTGELEQHVADRARCIGNLRIDFLGFKNQTELPGYYLAADILALPSTSETWGLVVNEALLAGCAVALSSGVGCAAEFSGLERVRVFSRESTSDFRSALLQLARYPKDFNWALSYMDRYSVRSAATAFARWLEEKKFSII